MKISHKGDKLFKFTQIVKKCYNINVQLLNRSIAAQMQWRKKTQRMEFALSQYLAKEDIK